MKENAAVEPVDGGSDPALVTRYEAAFSVLMAAVAYLGRDNPHLDYPEALYLLLAIMGLNLAAGFAIRLWPARPWVSLAAIVGNCAAVTSLLQRSGGPESNLWVLYLLPVFSTCLLLEGREVLWVTAGTVAFNVAFTASWTGGWAGAEVFGLALKNGILVLAAAVTWRVARRDRQSRGALAVKRAELAVLRGSLASQDQRLRSAERLADVGLMSSGLIHDLNNVFAVILGHAELLDGFREIPAEAAGDFAVIRESARLGRSIVSSFNRQARAREMPVEPCDLAEAVRSAVSMAREGARRRGVSLEMGLAPDLPPVIGDRAGLQRLLMNLLTNALEASGAGGRVRVSVEAQGDSSRGQGFLSVAVEDSGPGIPPEMMARLFRPFSTGREETEGHGLGLCISQSIAKQHGGLLCAENRGEGGARFTLHLPAPVPAGNA